MWLWTVNKLKEAEKYLYLLSIHRPQLRNKTIDQRKKYVRTVLNHTETQDNYRYTPFWLVLYWYSGRMFCTFTGILLCWCILDCVVHWITQLLSFWLFYGPLFIKLTLWIYMFIPVYQVLTGNGAVNQLLFVMTLFLIFVWYYM